MATLNEYFSQRRKLESNAFHKALPLLDADGTKLGEIIVRLHLDFEANAKYVSFYIPSIPSVACPEAMALNTLAAVVDRSHTNGIEVTMGFAGEAKDARSLGFSGQVYLVLRGSRPSGPER